MISTLHSILIPLMAAILMSRSTQAPSMNETISMARTILLAAEDL